MTEPSSHSSIPADKGSSSPPGHPRGAPEPSADTRASYAGAPAARFTSSQRIILWLACSAVFFEAFDVSIVNLALPAMAGSLRISLAEAQWVQTLYLLSFGGFLLLGGRLCDHAGSRTIFLAGMSVFCAASALAFASQSFPLLLLARGGQGVGAALAIPGGLSLLSRNFPEGRQRSTALGIFGAFAAIGFAGGLALGGMITSFLNWHWIFGVNVPVIIPVLAAGYYFIPGKEMHAGTPPDLLTACWLTSTLLLFCYTIHQLPLLGLLSVPLLLASLISGALLLARDRRQPRPFFARRLYPSGEGYRALAASSILGACFLGYIFLVTAGFYQVMQWDARSTGLLLFPYSIASALVSKFLLPVLFRRYGISRVAQLALVLLLAGILFLLTGIGTGKLAWFLVSLFLVNSLAIAIGYPALSILSLAGVPSDRQGIAAGLQAAIYTTGTGVGLSLIGLCLLSTPAYDIPAQLSLPCMVIALLCTIGVLLLAKPI